MAVSSDDLGFKFQKYFVLLSVYFFLQESIQAAQNPLCQKADRSTQTDSAVPEVGAHYIPPYSSLKGIDNAQAFKRYLALWAYLHYKSAYSEAL